MRRTNTHTAPRRARIALVNPPWTAKQEIDPGGLFRAFLAGRMRREDGQNRWFLFRRAFPLLSAADAAQLTITVDGRYQLFVNGVPMDSDMNKYDLNHVTTGHARMSKAEWEGIYKSAWQNYYTVPHIETGLAAVAT